MNPQIIYIILISLIYTANVESVTPVVLWHGMGDLFKNISIDYIIYMMKILFISFYFCISFKIIE